MGRPPRYWLTTHWPQLKGRPVEPYIYLQKKHKHLYKMQAGDKVLVYELKTGPAVIDSRTEEKISRHEGVQGIIAAVEVLDDVLQHRPDEDAIHNLGKKHDPPTMDFRWMAHTKMIAYGIISRLEVNSVLGFGEGNVFLGYGEDGCGIGEISSDQYQTFFQKLTRRNL